MVLPHLLLDRPTRFPEARAVPTAAMGVGIGRYKGKSHLASMLMVQALDPAHAQDIACAQHPTGRLSAVPAELLDGQDLHKLLAAWVRGEG